MLRRGRVGFSAVRARAIVNMVRQGSVLMPGALKYRLASLVIESRSEVSGDGA